MFAGFKAVPPTDGVGITASLLATIASVSKLPPESRPLAAAVHGALPTLVGEGERTHDALVAALGDQKGALSGRKGDVSRSLQAEAAADKAVKALAARLDALVGEEVDGGEAIRAYLLPEGPKALTKTKGRPQRAVYDTWMTIWPKRPRQGSPADMDIAGSLANVAAKIQQFADVLDGKDTVSRAADAAVDRRVDVHAAWLVAWGDLVDAVELIQATNPEAFKAWLSPYFEWRQAQQAAHARKAGAPGEPADEAEAEADAEVEDNQVEGRVEAEADGADRTA